MRKDGITIFVSKCPREERSRDPVNLREDLPEAVVRVLHENTTLEGMVAGLGEGRKLVYERSKLKFDQAA